MAKKTVAVTTMRERGDIMRTINITASHSPGGKSVAVETILTVDGEQHTFKGTLSEDHIEALKRLVYDVLSVATKG